MKVGTCEHQGRLTNADCDVQELRRRHSRRARLRGTCSDCGNLVEREYGSIRTLPVLEANTRACLRCRYKPLDSALAEQ
jgi:hypothetical protein